MKVWFLVSRPTHASFGEFRALESSPESHWFGVPTRRTRRSPRMSLSAVAVVEAIPATRGKQSVGSAALMDRK